MRPSRCLPTFAILLSLASFARAADAPAIDFRDHDGDLPLVLDQPADYTIQNVHVAHLHDTAAITLAGRINSVQIANSQFGDVEAGPDGRAAGLEAAGATVEQITVSDTRFYDAEKQLVSLRDGSFGTVTFERCTFETSDSCLQKIYAHSPARMSPPAIEFYNIDRLELLDNTYTNTVIVIHPSVKTVIFRGDVSRLRLQSDKTQVIRLRSDDDLAPNLTNDGSPRASAGAAADAATTIATAVKYAGTPAGLAREISAATPEPVAPLASNLPLPSAVNAWLGRTLP